VRNTRLQSLDVALPPDARIFETFVDGRPVVPGVRRVGDVPAVRIPITGARAPERAFPVRVMYETKLSELGMWGGIPLDFPGANVPMVKLGVELTVPEEYEFLFTRGTLRSQRRSWDYGELLAARAQTRQRVQPGQFASNKMQAQIEQRARGKGQFASTQAAVEPGMLARLGGGKTFRFEKLLAVSDPEAERALSSPAYLRVRYATARVRAVVTVVLVLAVALGGAVLLWKTPPRLGYGAMGGAAVLFTLVNALSERFYPEYVMWVAGVAWAMLAVMLIVHGAKRLKDLPERLGLQPSRRRPSPPPDEPPVLPTEDEEKKP